MTVAIGFHCKDGVVLAADSEISNAYMKYQGDKAWVYKYSGNVRRFELQVGIVGAGDASFIQYAAEGIDASLRAEIAKRKRLTMDEVNSLIQGVINDLHHSHLYPVPPSTHEPPSVELIIGIWLKSTRNRLARTRLTAITKVWNYEAVGVGSALANFIIRRFYGGRVTVAQAVFIATQVLMHVKENVPACGGQSKVIAMFKHGVTGFVRQETLSDHERFLKSFDDAIAPAFFGGSDPTLNDVDFAARVDTLGATLKSLRKVALIEHQAEQVRQDASAPVSASSDMSGVTPSTPQTGQPSTTAAQKSPKRDRKRQPPSRA